MFLHREALAGLAAELHRIPAPEDLWSLEDMEGELTVHAWQCSLSTDTVSALCRCQLAAC